MMTRTFAAIAMLAAALAALAGCGDAPPPGEPAVQDTPSAETPAALAEEAAGALFADTCLGLTASQEVCACVRERVVEASGLVGLGYIGAAYGGQPALAEPYEARMSQAERNIAAEAFLDGQFDCVMAQDPDYAPVADAQTPPLDQGDEESPFEQAVGACVAAGAAPEPECRCRAETVFDALGQDGLVLARAAEAGEDQALAMLADENGLAWLEEGRAALQNARAECAP